MLNKNPNPFQRTCEMADIQYLHFLIYLFFILFIQNLMPHAVALRPFLFKIQTKHIQTEHKI